MTSKYHGVLRLLQQSPHPPGWSMPGGPQTQQIADLEAAVGFAIPAAVVEWLEQCNGCVAGPGVLFGATSGCALTDILSAMELWPRWRQDRWLPIASDGSGNFFVAVAYEHQVQVFFVECTLDPGRLSYIFGSSVERFLEFLLEGELGESGWPFDPEYVLSRDPDIRYSTGPLPWLVDAHHEERRSDPGEPAQGQSALLTTDG